MPSERLIKAAALVAESDYADDEVAVMSDVILEEGWYDDRAMPLFLGHTSALQLDRHWFDSFVATRWGKVDFKRACVAIIFFGDWDRDVWPVVRSRMAKDVAIERYESAQVWINGVPLEGEAGFGTINFTSKYSSTINGVTPWWDPLAKTASFATSLSIKQPFTKESRNERKRKRKERKNVPLR